MKWTPFLSHWEEQRHLLVWVGLGRDKSFADIPIGKFIFTSNYCDPLLRARVSR
jgi:hypothetical protein